MGEVLAFVLRPAKKRSPHQPGMTATIEFFPGVRIELLRTVDENVATEPSRRKRTRTVGTKVKTTPDETRNFVK